MLGGERADSRSVVLSAPRNGFCAVLFELLAVLSWMSYPNRVYRLSCSLITLSALKILLSNDDGCRAAGLVALHRAVSEIASVIVVAPDRNRSGTGSALTLDRALAVHEQSNGFKSVDGTPADCVMLALTDLLDEDPEMVISGINNGANLGDDVLYSGTVGAAMEGRVLGGCSIAVSLACAHAAATDDSTTWFETAARVTVELVERLRTNPTDKLTILNVNVPNRPYDQLRGWEVTRLGSRGRSAPAIPETATNGHPLWRIGPAGEAVDDGPGTDFNAITRDRVSITPINIDRTETERMSSLDTWLNGPGEHS